MPSSRTHQFLGSVVLFGCITLFSAPAHAQPPANNPNEMCGDGTTFTVQLPGKTLGIDDSDGFFQSISVPAVARDDSVTLPNGCRMYAILISGYGTNNTHTDIIFFKVAEFVAKHNGYVHVGWWNNFHKEYSVGPLHPENIVIRRLFLPDEVIYPSPATDFDPRSFLPLVNILDRPKANPDDDDQFQSDAELVIQAIRANNPNAIIMVAGHSMGGNAVARLGMKAGVPIDLLAPIDPVGNRDKPRGIVGQKNFNWTRWRVNHSFAGYKRWNCERNFLGLCRDYDDRLFHTSFKCKVVEPWLDVKPLFGSFAPIACPYSAYTDPGTLLGFGSNIKRLYHRWQHEFFWPVDFLRTERFKHPKPLSSSVLGPNYQEPVLPNLNPLSLDPDKTCAFPEVLGIGVPDPRDPSFNCDPDDGHGEIIGVRGNSEIRPGFRMEGGWPSSDIPLGILNSANRRAKMIELATADASWPHRPQNPNLCMVCDDMITILQDLLAQQPQPPPTVDVTAPVSIATANPGPGPAGWNNEDVVVDVKAVDEQNGSGVKEIGTSLSGAQFGSMLTPGPVAQETITVEGKTIVTFFARDIALNTETAQMLDVWIDKTPPLIAAITDSDPNGNGWFRFPVLVSFPASDEANGSGLANSTADVPVSTPGANQEVTGTAEDNAGNTASASVTLNIDLTLPSITLASRTPAANAAGWNNTDVTFLWDCADALSGPAAPNVTQSLATEGAAQMLIGTCMDLADNTASDTQSGINIDKSPPAITFAGQDPQANAAGWNNSNVTLSWNCADSISGPLAAAVSQLLTSEGNNLQATGTCTDLAGNAASHTQFGVKIDKTPPAVSITTPPSGAAYLLNAAVNSDYGCSDSLSGLASCTGTVANGAAINTSTVGSKQFTVNSTDVAGNAASATHTYTVQYAFSGFANPIGPLPMVNVAKAGRTVPVKYFLQDAGGAFITNLASFSSLMSAPVSCDSSAPGVLAEETDAAGSTAIRYDAATNQFIYNWKTDAAWAGTCRALQLTLNDGAQYVAMFRFN